MTLHSDDEMQACIAACLACYHACLSHAMHHEPPTASGERGHEHFKTLLACAEMCRTCAHILLIGTPQHRHSCAACAAICTECAMQCEHLDEVQDCVQACRRCAELCEKMSA